MRVLHILGVTTTAMGVLLGGCAADAPRDQLLPQPDDLRVTSGGSALAEGSAVEICAGRTADPTGQTDASSAINACIAAAPAGGLVALPPGTYRLDAPVVIARSDVTLTTRGLAGTPWCGEADPRCAKLRASAGFDADALLRIGSPTRADRVVVDHVILDGNGAARRSDAGAARAACAAGRGRTIMAYTGDDNALVDSAVVGAMCGTAIGWSVSGVAARSRIQRNFVAHNGVDHTRATGLWSDGLTHDLVVEDNVFLDDTDVDLILGGATGASRIQRNTILHQEQESFAAFMLTNWSDPNDFSRAQWADFRGLDVSGNTIACGSRCEIGMVLGVLPWFYDATYWTRLRTMGGRIHDNSIQTTKQGVLVAGAGTPEYPLVLGPNRYDVVPNAATATFAQPGVRATGKLNVHALWDESFVAFTGGEETKIDGTDAWHKVY